MNGMTRRHFFGVNSTGVGLAALAGLLGPRRARRRSRRARRSAPFPGHRQARDLSLPVRRPFADGALRLQAAPARIPGHRSAGVRARRPAAHRHVGHAIQFPRRALEIRLRAARPVRRLGQRTAALHRQDRRPAHLHQDASTPKRSITIRPSPWRRPASAWAAGRAWARGSPTESAARPKTCRPSA